MKTSSAARRLDEASGVDEEIANFGPVIPPQSGNTSLFPSPSREGVSSDTIAATARIAGRLSAAKIPQHEVNQWLRERSLLLDKKLSGSLSAKEARRLQYVRWTLDRIDDARYGIALDKLEEAVRLQEEMAAKIQALTTELHAASKTKNDRRN